MTLRRRIADHPAVLAFASRLLSGWMRLVYRTSRISLDGWDEVERLVEQHGAVILVVWHQRLMMTPYCFGDGRFAIRSLTSTGRPGRIAGMMHERFGIHTIPMPRGTIGVAETRTVISGLREGCSIGIAADGPRGPVFEVKETPIKWARATQVPVVCFAFSCRRYWTLPTWDKLMLPRLFNRCTLVWRIWDTEVPKRLSAEETTALSEALKQALDSVTAAADRAVAQG